MRYPFAPAPDSLGLFLRQALAGVLLQGERGEQVLAHDPVLELGRLAQHVDQRLAVLDHERGLRRRQAAPGGDDPGEPAGQGLLSGLFFGALGHQERGMGYSAFRPQRKCRSLPSVFDIMFACPATVCNRSAGRRRSCCGTARTPGTCGISRSSRLPGGVPGAARVPGTCRQLTQARAGNPWLAAGSQTVQQQALRDFDQAMRNFFNGTHRRPTWRKAGRDGIPRRRPARAAMGRPPPEPALGGTPSRRAGWVRFRWSRAVPDGVKSFRVTRDHGGRWHVAFAASPVPSKVPAPARSSASTGGERSAALSTGETLHCPGLLPREAGRLRRLERRLAKAKRGSNRRGKVKLQVARLKARETDRRKDWCEKASTAIARRFDVIRVEDLKITNMIRSAKGTVDTPGRNVAQKAGLNREISRSGWGLLVRRLEDKAPDGSRRSTPRIRASGARRAATSHRRVARAKPSSAARPAITPPTLT